MFDRSQINSILDRARSRVAGMENEKTASASGSVSEVSDLVKEATEIADALEFVALSGSTTPEGKIANSMIASFLKNATSGPAVTASAANGTQAQPGTGSAKTPVSTPSAGSPPVSKAQDGKMPENPLVQTPPAVRATPTEGKKLAAGSLAEMLLGGKKEAGSLGGPAESTATEDAANIPKSNENSNMGVLSSNASVVAASKRELKAPTRARLAEVLANVRDTASSTQAANAVLSNATGKGLKEAAAACAPKKTLKKMAAEYTEKDRNTDTKRRESAMAAFSPALAPAVTAEKGKKVRTLVGAALGGAAATAAGGLLGGRLGGRVGSMATRSVLKDNPDIITKGVGLAQDMGAQVSPEDVFKGLEVAGDLGGRAIGGVSGAVAARPFGRAGGAYAAHGGSGKKKEKTASALSLEEASLLASLARDGELGDVMKAHFASLDEE